MPDPKKNMADELGLEQAGDSLADSLGLEQLAPVVGREVTASPAKKWESVQDAGNIAVAGATMGFDDEIAGVVGGLGEAFRNPLGDPRQTFAKGYQSARAAREASKAESMERSPIAGAAGYAGGAVASGGGLQRAGAALGSKAIQMAGGGAKAAEGAGLAARGGTAVGNLAVPGAIMGAGEAQTAADIPEAAATGAAINTAAGGALSGIGKVLGALPGAAGWAQRGADKTFLQSTGVEGATLKNIAKEPGGQRARVEAMQRMGIGKGIWPTARKAAEQAENAVDLKNLERQALVDAAGDVRIPSEQNARYMRQAAQRDYPAQVADEGIRARIAAEADKQALAGRQGYTEVTGRRPVQPPVTPRGPAPEGPQVVDVTGQRAAAQAAQRSTAVGNPQLQASSPLVPPAPEVGFEGQDLAARYFARQQAQQTPARQAGSALARRADDMPVIQGELEPPPGNAVERYSHTSPLVAGEEYSERVATGPYRTLQQQQDEIVAYNRRAFDAQKARAGEDAAVNRTLGAAVNDSAEDSLNKISPGLGTAWRGNKFDTNIAIKSHDSAVETAGKPMVMRSAGRGFARAATMFGTGTGNYPVAAAGLAADIAMTPQLQMHAYRGVQGIAQGAGALYNTALGRVLAKMPGARFGGAMSLETNMGPQGREGLEAVQRAALESPDRAASEHYIQNQTNPEYAAEANRKEGE